MRGTLGVAALLCAALTGCQTVVGGTAEPADHFGAPTTTAKPPSLEDTLLSPAEIAGIVGETTMTQVDAFTRPLSAPQIEPTECVTRAFPAQEFLYAIWYRMTGTTMRGDGDHTLTQVVSTYPAEADAKEMVSFAAAGWQHCSHPFTIWIDLQATHWTATPVADETTRISASRQKREDPGRICQHVMAAQHLAVVEILLCGDDGQTAPQADAITDRILAKIPE